MAFADKGLPPHLDELGQMHEKDPKDKRHPEVQAVQNAGNARTNARKNEKGEMDYYGVPGKDVMSSDERKQMGLKADEANKEPAAGMPTPSKAGKASPFALTAMGAFTLGAVYFAVKALRK